MTTEPFAAPLSPASPDDPLDDWKQQSLPVAIEFPAGVDEA